MIIFPRPRDYNGCTSHFSLEEDFVCLFIEPSGIKISVILKWFLVLNLILKSVSALMKKS